MLRFLSEGSIRYQESWNMPKIPATALGISYLVKRQEQNVGTKHVAVLSQSGDVEIKAG
jgi:5,10-methylene-tetrahydrofolate dehydrogenase/methenyl tetrahydrofolate cyclohydrolase